MRKEEELAEEVGAAAAAVAIPSFVGCCCNGGDISCGTATGSVMGCGRFLPTAVGEIGEVGFNITVEGVRTSCANVPPCLACRFSFYRVNASEKAVVVVYRR